MKTANKILHYIISLDLKLIYITFHWISMAVDLNFALYPINAMSCLRYKTQWINEVDSIWFLAWPTTQNEWALVTFLHSILFDFDHLVKMSWYVWKFYMRTCCKYDPRLFTPKRRFAINMVIVRPFLKEHYRVFFSLQFGLKNDIPCIRLHFLEARGTCKTRTYLVINCHHEKLTETR